MKIQVKLLRFLQEGTFEKVGGEKRASVDVRIISAANKSLKEEVRSGRFREDLYYRLNVIPIHLPPLRKRKNDIPLLAAHFLKQAEQENNASMPVLSGETLNRLLDYDWPGNVRELKKRDPVFRSAVPGQTDPALRPASGGHPGIRSAPVPFDRFVPGPSA